MRQELSTQLQQFSAWERMSTQYDQLLRAVYKEFHCGGRYYKGKGADFASWMLEHHPNAFFMHIERADGGRQASKPRTCPYRNAHVKTCLSLRTCDDSTSLTVLLLLCVGVQIRISTMTQQSQSM